MCAIIALIEPVATELQLGSADIKDALYRLASQPWTDGEDDRQLSPPSLDQVSIPSPIFTSKQKGE
jgi:hypothetical protein